MCVKHVQSNLSINSSFRFDGTLEKEQLKKYFVINWTRHSAPSRTKWTRDVYEAGNNSPGYIRLSLPALMFFTRRAHRNFYESSCNDSSSPSSSTTTLDAGEDSVPLTELIALVRRTKNPNMTSFKSKLSRQ